jgi:polyisoprenoid-binding protein YceI
MLAGELTILDETRPVTLAVETALAGFRAQATTRIDRYSFGLTPAKGTAAGHLDIDPTATAQPR